MGKLKILVYGRKINYDKEKYDVFYINNTAEKNNYSSYQDFSKQHKLGEKDMFISYLSPVPMDTRLFIPQIPFDVLVVCPETNNLEEIMKNIQDYKKKDYDIYGGKKIETKDSRIIESIKRNIKDIFDISTQMRHAGYLYAHNTKKIEDWIVMFQDPFLQIFVEHYGPETSNSTMTVEDEFMDNPYFRLQILISFLKTISNFLINNNYIKQKELEKYQNWYDEKLWDFIKENVDFL